MEHRVLCGDSLRLLTELEAGSVDGVITDCPYSSGGMTRSDRADKAKNKYVDRKYGNVKLDDFEGDSRDQRSFGYWCSLWYAEALRVAKPGAVICSFTDWRQLPISTDALQAGGWVWRGLVPWDKTEAARPQKGRFRAQCEYIVFGTKGPHAAYGDDAPCLPGFYRFPFPRERDHITQKPVELMAELATLVPPNGVILDPFAGSGSTAVGAARAGRRSISFELSERNAQLIRERLEAEATVSTRAAMAAGQGALFG